MNIPSRAAGAGGIDTSRFAPLMDQFTPNLATGVPPDVYGQALIDFSTAHPYSTWYRAWQVNSGTFLQTLCYGFDRWMGGPPAPAAWREQRDPSKFIRGAMDDRHLTNLARVSVPGGLSIPDHVRGKNCLVVGCWSGEEMLLLSALGAKMVSGVEEVPQYAELAELNLKAFELGGQVVATSLYSLPEEMLRPTFDLVYMPGVLYHLTDPVAALAILWSITVPGGRLAIETAYSPGMDGAEARYLGPSVPGWNWWAPSVRCMEQMMEDCGFCNAHQVENVGGRAWFMGTRSDSLPLFERGAAGFSRPDLLRCIVRT